MQEIKVDYSLPLREIAPLLNHLSREAVEEEGGYPMPDEVEIESRISEQKWRATNFSRALSGSGKYRSLRVLIVMVLCGNKR